MNFSVPNFVDYPKLYNVLDNLKMFHGVFSYIIEPYPLNGISLYIGIRGEYVVCRIADFKSNEIGQEDLNDDSSIVLLWSQSLKEVMKSARVPDALFYFSVGDNIQLVDVMLSANKFVGPGMLRDLFGKVVPIQNTIETIVIDQDEISEYKGKIIKPSRFRYLTEDGLIRPQYGIV